MTRPALKIAALGYAFWAFRLVFRDHRTSGGPAQPDRARWVWGVMVLLIAIDLGAHTSLELQDTEFQAPALGRDGCREHDGGQTQHFIEDDLRRTLTSRRSSARRTMASGTPTSPDASKTPPKNSLTTRTSY